MRLRRSRDRLFTTLDARGRRISSLAPNRVDRQQRRARAAGLLSALLWVGLAMFGAAFVLALILVVRTREPAVAWAIAGVALLALGFAAGLAAELYIIARVTARWHRIRQLRAHICPSCGYGLVGLAPEADGCTVCPECSAAWRLAGPPRRYGLIAPAPALEEPRGPVHAARQCWRRFSAFEDARGTRWGVGAPGAVLLRRLGRTARAARLTAIIVPGVAGFFAAPALVSALVLWSAEHLIGPPPGWVVGAVLILSFVAVLTTFVLVGTWFERTRLHHRLAECLGSGLCAACGRCLAGVPGAADECTECPDCGAAWRTAEIGGREPRA